MSQIHISLSPVSAIPCNQSLYSRYLKRGFDFIFGLALLVISLPFMIAIFLAVKFDSSGPGLYAQQRGGYGGKSIRIYKFRTLYADMCDNGAQQVTSNDKRITHFGKLLRCTSLDELPQLWNVVKGDMSLIGPRPHALPMDDYYTQHIPGYAERYHVRPGLSGWAQVHNRRGETKVIADMANRIAYDLEYVRHHSFLMDIKIAIRTLIVLMKCEC